jgi:hypothetical protein
MAAMIDTNVLVFASQGATLKPRSKSEEKQFERNARDMSRYYDVCAKLLNRLATVKVCAVTIIEFRRSVHKQHIEWFDALLPRLRVVQIDGEIAMKSSELLRSRDSSVEKVCRKCLSSLNEHVCGKCNLRVSSYRRINDATIVAAAEIDEDTEVLYSFDGPIHSFQPQLKQCLIRSPFELSEQGIQPTAPAHASMGAAETPKSTRRAPLSQEEIDRARGQSSLFGLFAKESPALEAGSGVQDPDAPPGIVHK